MTWQHIHTAARRELLTRAFWTRRQLDLFGFGLALRREGPAPAGGARRMEGPQGRPDGNHGENLK